MSNDAAAAERERVPTAYAAPAQGPWPLAVFKTTRHHVPDATDAERERVPTAHAAPAQGPWPLAVFLIASHHVQ